MSAKRDVPSRMLKAIHKTASEMYDANLIDLRRMEEYNLLCLLPVPTYSAAKIKALRTWNKLSQIAFAAVLHISVSTVHQWEIGARRPNGPSMKLLDLLERKGLDALI